MITHKRILLSALAFLSAFAKIEAQQPQMVLKSPQGDLTMTLAIRAAKEDKPQAGEPSASGQLVYSLSYRGKVVLEESTLGLDLEGGALLGANVHVTGSEPSSGVDDYTLAMGKTSHVHDPYQSLKVSVAEDGRAGRAMEIEARAYDSGVAFRYVLPDSTRLAKEVRLRQEATQFQFSSDAMTWALALPNYRSSYESEYVNLPVSAFSNQGGVPSHFLIGLPLLAHEPGTAWVAITEADLEGSAGMYLTNPSGSWQGHGMTSLLSPQFDNFDLAVTGWMPWHSAWRVVLVADDPGRLVESNVITDLNPPNALKDTSWIKAGKASWDWWNGDQDANGKPAYTTENMKRYVDFAAESGFDYFMLDAGWSTDDITKMRGNVDVPELCRYAKTKNVKVWIWLYASYVMKQMKEAFPLYEQWGVAGLKIDFINRDDQDGIQFYYNVAREAAAHHLMVDFHGASKPWGIAREYPNVMSHEGILGMEQSKAGSRDNPAQRTVYPFTRMVAGPMDYTPGSFNNVTPDNFVARNVDPTVMGTRAQQLALYVVYETPFQMVSDSPQAYRGQPGFDFIREVPAAWDETRVLAGRPGESATIARRSGKDWYVGSINNWSARDVTVPLSFLGDGTYDAEIYADAADAATEPKHLEISHKAVGKSDTLTLHLAPGGGAAIRIQAK